MKKFKKLFLSAAMLGSLCVLGAGLITNADDTAPIDPTEPTLTENFSFVENFDYGDGTLIKGSGSNHNYGGQATPGNYKDELVHGEDEDYLRVYIERDLGDETGKAFSVRTGGTGNLVALSGDNKDAVIKARFKTSTQERKSLRLFMCGSNYDVLNIYNNSIYYAINGVTSVKDSDNDLKKKQFAEYETYSTSLASNVWHEAVIILRDNGAVVDGKSVDTITTYVDGEYIYTKNFFDANDYTGTVGQFLLFYYRSNKTTDEFCLDYVKAGELNAPVATAPIVSDVKVGVPFSLEPTITGTNTAYLPSITPERTVDFYLNDEALEWVEDTTNDRWVSKSGDDEIIAEEFVNGQYQYTGLKEVQNLKAKFTFTADLAEPVEVTFDIATNTEPIPVTGIATAVVVDENNVLTLGVNETFDVSKIFRATPSTADDLTLNYVVSDDSVFGLDTETGILQGVAKGTATLTVTAVGGTNVSRVITINVVDGPYDLINSYEIGKTWEAETTFNEKVWQGKIHNKKEFCPISSVEDGLFGKAIKFVGTGAVNKGGSHLDLHIPYLASGGDTDTADDDVYYLNWDKDYKLTGYIKTDVTTATSGEFSIKVIGYAPGTNGAYYFKAPYIIEVNVDINNNGWMYFESDPINFDYYVMDNGETYPIQGFKIELGVWNVMEGVDLYASHLNLVELDTVKYIDWNLTEYISSQYYYKLITGEELKKSAGSTYQITALAVPSSAEMTVTYSSSDETLATVDQTGLVTFLNKSGKVTITATNSDGTSKIVIFDIQNTAQSITVPEGQENVVLSIGDTVKSVDVTITPADATSTYTVTVGDSTLCTTRFLNSKLQIVPLKVGTTTITIVANDNENATLTLTVTIKGYSITYNINGHGEAQNAVENVTALPQELPTLTAEGWVFGGWFLDADCTQAATPEAPLSADVTLYAKWTKEGQATYKITYNVNGHGTAPSEVTDAVALPTTLPTLTAEGWKFEGWFLDADCTQAATAGATLTADITLYAKWSADGAKSFKVTYNVNGHGTAPAELTNVTALPATLPTLTAEGWTFEGWYLDADCKTKAEAGKEITEDTTLYAKWTKKTDPVTPTTPEDKGVNVAAIVVPIVVVVVLAVAGVLVYFFVFKKKEPKNKE